MSYQLSTIYKPAYALENYLDQQKVALEEELEKPVVDAQIRTLNAQHLHDKHSTIMHSAIKTNKAAIAVFATLAASGVILVGLGATLFFFPALFPIVFIGASTASGIAAFGGLMTLSFIAAAIIKQSVHKKFMERERKKIENYTNETKQSDSFRKYAEEIQTEALKDFDDNAKLTLRAMYKSCIDVILNNAAFDHTNFEDNFNKNDFDFLAKAGPHISSLSIEPKPSNAPLSKLRANPEIYQNLFDIDWASLNFADYAADNLDQILLYFPNLQQLHMPTTVLSEDDIASLPRNLESLTIKSFSPILMRALERQCPNLKKLTLTKSPDCFEQLLYDLPEHLNYSIKVKVVPYVDSLNSDNNNNDGARKGKQPEFTQNPSLPNRPILGHQRRIYKARRLEMTPVLDHPLLIKA